MKLFIVDIKPKSKIIYIVYSERRLYNLVPFNPTAFQVLVKMHPEYKIYELDEKHFKSVGKQGNRKKAEK